MLELMRARDKDLVELVCGSRGVLLAPSLGGRIFCQFDGELVHRLDAAAWQNPSATEYDNLGGNSLWPAPEGGAFAFNYPHGGDQWYVQDGIAKAVPTIRREGTGAALVEKRIGLVNRKGVEIEIDYRRAVSLTDAVDGIGSYDLEGMSYSTDDIFEPLGRYSAESLLVAPWSLEQFPGAERILAFSKVAGEDPINSDFYGDPGDRIARVSGGFVLRLGGVARHQIGVTVGSAPDFIGALDFERSMLFLREARREDGAYFNIADNEQPQGPYSAKDLYSIFNGGELGFFELETIGAMNVSEGALATSTLHSRTTILKGDVPELLRFLANERGLDLGSVTA